MLHYKKQLFEDGFCVIPDIVSKETVITLRKKYLPYFSEHKLTFTVDEILANSDLYNIVFSPKLIEIIISLLGSRYCIYPDFTLRSSVYVPWHTDVPYLSTCDANSNILPNFMQVSLYLQDNTPEQGGGLDAIVGSHRYKNIDYQNFDTNNIDVSTWVQMPSLAGSLTIWDSRLVHRSSLPSSNNNPQTKLALQWTISRDDKFSDKYLNFISNRIQAKYKDPIYDKTNREAEHLFSMLNLRYPESFSDEQILILEKYNIILKTF